MHAPARTSGDRTAFCSTSDVCHSLSRFVQNLSTRKSQDILIRYSNTSYILYHHTLTRSIQYIQYIYIYRNMIYIYIWYIYIIYIFTYVYTYIWYFTSLHSLHDRFRIIPGYPRGGVAWPWFCGSLGFSDRLGASRRKATAAFEWWWFHFPD